MWSIECWNKDWKQIHTVETFALALIEVRRLSGTGKCSRGLNLDVQPGEYREIRSFPPKFVRSGGRSIEVRGQTTWWWT